MIYMNNPDFSFAEDTVVTIGNFDGFHLGHIKLINKTVEISNLHGINSVLLTFSPHPKKVMANIDTKTIYSQTKKQSLASDLGINIFIDYPFSTDFAKTTPFDFVKTFLSEKLKCKYLVIGEDYTFGQNKAGNVCILQELCKDLNIELFVISHEMYVYDNLSKKISSTDILKFIEDKNFLMAEKLLARKYIK